MLIIFLESGTLALVRILVKINVRLGADKMKKKCLISVTVPGTIHNIRGECSPPATSKHPVMDVFISLLHKHGITGRITKDGNGEGYDWEGWEDSLPGWGCLDQDWFTFEADVETSWGWCEISAFSEQEKEWFWGLLHHGALIMHVRYLGENGELELHR